jgi:hypothetical protein
MPKKVSSLRKILERWRQKLEVKPFDPAKAG